MEIDAELQRFLLRPQREIHVELVITMDSGEVESFNAYRVQHNNFRGPYKGGYRLAPDVDMQEMRRYQPDCWPGCLWVCHKAVPNQLQHH